MKFYLVYILLVLSQPIFSYAGKFWQITDVHLDNGYSEHGDPNNMCHNDSSASGKEIGYFGNYHCDSPYTLVESSIKAMAEIDPNPEFILWTGDNSPHTENPTPHWPEIFDELSKITELVIKYFPNSSIVPVLGNHDSFPKDQFPLVNKTFYSDYLDKGSWSKIIQESEKPTFIKGGYYSRKVGNLTILVLNTMLYSYTNELCNLNDTDPAQQFDWLEKQLQEAKNESRKVILTSHEPPGFFERINLVPFLHDKYIQIYDNITMAYGDVIMAQMFGHTHTDSFRLFAYDREHIKSSAFIVPSVTPLGIIPSSYGNKSAVNPAIRLYQHNDEVIQDYFQYYLNLSIADETLKPNWTLLYKFTEAYGLPDVSVNSLVNLYIKFTNMTSPEFTKYYYFNTVGAPSPKCDANCWQNHICGIAHLTTEAMNKCWSRNDTAGSSNNVTDTAEPFTPASANHGSVIGRVIVGLLVVTVLTICGALCFKKMATYRENRRYSRFFSSTGNNVERSYVY